MEGNSSSYMENRALCITPLGVLKIHSRRETEIPSFKIVKIKETAQRMSFVSDEIEKVTKQLYHLSASNYFHDIDIKKSFNTEIIDKLTPSQLDAYNRCLEFLQDNNLPNYYNYYIVDFLAATREKFTREPAIKIINKIAKNYAFSANSILSGHSPISGTLGKSILTTYPKAMTPLFFHKMQFVSRLCKDRIVNARIRQNSEDCLNITFFENLRSLTRKFILAKNAYEFECLVGNPVDELTNEMWMPELVFSKYNQLTMYLDNVYPKQSKLLHFVALSYICHKTNYGLQVDNLKISSATELFNEMKKEFEQYLLKKNDKSIFGWSIFSSTLKHDSCLLTQLDSLFKNLSKNHFVENSSDEFIKKTDYIISNKANIA